MFYDGDAHGACELRIVPHPLFLVTPVNEPSPSSSSSLLGHPDAGRGYITIMVFVWGTFPVFASVMTRGNAPALMMWFGGIEYAGLFFLPFAGGLWCGSSEASLARRIGVLAGGVVAATCLVAAATVLAELGISERLSSTWWIAGRLTFVAGTIGATAIWGVARVFTAYVVRRGQLTIGSLIVGFVVLAIDIALVRALSNRSVFGPGLFGFSFATGAAILLGVVLISTLYWRRIEGDLVGIGAILFLGVIIPSVVAGGSIPAELVVFTFVFTLSLYAMLRMAIEVGVINWRPPEPQPAADEIEPDSEPDSTHPEPSPP